MANVNGFYNPAFYAATALSILKNRLGMANRVYMGFDAERKVFGLGDTINIRRPSTFTATVAPSATAQDMATESLSLVLSNWREVKFKLTDKEYAFTGERIINDHVMPAAYALANQIDVDLAALAYEVPMVTAAASTYASADIVSARRALFDQQCPLDNPADLNFMVGGGAEQDFLNAAIFSQFNTAGQMGTQTLASAQLGNRFGFNFFSNQNVNQYGIQSAVTFTTPTVSGAHARGVTSLLVAATVVNAQVFKKGFSFTIAGDTQKYSITADATVSGPTSVTFAISPALQVAASGAQALTVSASTPIAGTTPAKDQNLAFHRNAFALAFGKLTDYGEFGSTSLGVRAFSVQDDVTGIAVRARMYALPDVSEIRVCLDALYGVRTLQPNYAVRLRQN